MKTHLNGIFPPLLGLLCGIGLGLLYSWQISPVAYIDAEPSILRADFKDQYRIVIAAAYDATRDLPRDRAALDGAREVGFTIVSMTVSLAAVFVPVLFLGGIVGRLFREFAVTIGVAVLVSGVVSLTLTPMLCGRLLRPAGAARRGVLYRWSEAAFDAVVRAYAASLRFALRRRWISLLFTVAVSAAAVLLFQRVPKGFLPTQDTDQINITGEAQEGSSFEAAVEHQRQLAAIVAREYGVPAVFGVPGVCVFLN
jgi:multidrug efflux pump